MHCDCLTFRLTGVKSSVSLIFYTPRKKPNTIRPITCTWKDNTLITEKHSWQRSKLSCLLYINTTEYHELILCGIPIFDHDLFISKVHVLKSQSSELFPALLLFQCMDLRSTEESVCLSCRVWQTVCMRLQELKQFSKNFCHWHLPQQQKLPRQSPSAWWKKRRWNRWRRKT